MERIWFITVLDITMTWWKYAPQDDLLQVWGSGYKDELTQLYDNGIPINVLIVPIVFSPEVKPNNKN